MPSPSDIASRESALQKAVTVWIVTGIAFMLLPGTFLGVWNLIAISGQQTAAHIDPAWIQAHGHAQVFGWIGSFILGIGFYSLSKMAGVPQFSISRVWVSWVFWTTGVFLRWLTNLYQWHWRQILQISTLLELAGFLIFLITVSSHRREENRPPRTGASSAIWMRIVIAGTIGFLVSLLANLATGVQSSMGGTSPAIPHAEDQLLLVLYTWTFIVVTVWGFSARWLPVFLGLRTPNDRLLAVALGVDLAAAASAVLGYWVAATILFMFAAGASAVALGVFRPSVQPPKILGVHKFPDIRAHRVCHHPLAATGDSIG
jgi:uncharacterized protein involved in response to NO